MRHLKKSLSKLLTYVINRVCSFVIIIANFMLYVYLVDLIGLQKWI